MLYSKLPFSFILLFICFSYYKLSIYTMVIPTFKATKEQITYALNTVQNSLNLGFKDNFAGKQTDKKSIELMRFRGFLGEVLFAAAYNLPVPKNCYGLNGQDFGSDFIIKGRNIDIKTVGLNRCPNFCESVNYTLPLSMINAPNKRTDYYFFIALVGSGTDYKAYFIGSLEAATIKQGRVGTKYKAGQMVRYGQIETELKSDCLKFNISQINEVKHPDKLNKMPLFECVNIR
jgi:hypothetical protein